MRFSVLLPNICTAREARTVHITVFGEMIEFATSHPFYFGTFSDNEIII
jgi:hypothetical protein